MDVNTIFKDLGMLVHEQGEVLGKLFLKPFGTGGTAVLKNKLSVFTSDV